MSADQPARAEDDRDRSLRDDHIQDDDGSGVVCPVPCPWCHETGDCEDCLDCLLWPEVLDHRSGPAAALPGPSSPLRTRDVAAARAKLGLTAKVGLVVRRYRRQQLLSQRSLADRLGWHHSTLTRAEGDASALTLRKVERLLRETGHRLAIVPVAIDVARPLGEDPDEAWGVPDLLAMDEGGRRLPPYGQVTWNSDLDRRLYAPSVGHEAEWTWQRPRGPITPPER